MNRTQADKQKCLDAIREHGKDAMVELEVRELDGSRVMTRFWAKDILAMIDRNYKDCPMCYGSGKILSLVITHGTSVIVRCNVCQGTGLMNVEEPEQEANRDAM